MKAIQSTEKNIDTLTKNLMEVDLKRKEFEREKCESIRELKRKQENLKNIFKSSEKKAELECITNLESKIRELDKKCELQNVLYEEMQLEITSFKKLEQKKNSWKEQRSYSSEHARQGSISSPVDTIPSVSDTLFTGNLRKQSANRAPLESIKFEDIMDTERIIRTIPATSSFVTASNSSNDKHKEIDQILARLEQDNKTLAELERSRNTIGSPISSINLERMVEQRLRATDTSDLFLKDLVPSTSSLDNDYSQINLKTKHFSNAASSLTLKDLDKLMAKLEQDNKILAELDKKVKRVASNNMAAQSVFLSSSLPSLSATQFGRASSLLNATNIHGSGSNVNYGLGLMLHNANIPIAHIQHRADELRIAEDVVDSIEIPNRGRCKVFIARYSYDPFKQSPNENPEQELHLNAGDFILIFGDMDEDGFFLGELLDGRRGLVPSNFVEKLTGEDLFEFQASVLYGNRDGEESNASYPPEFYDAILNDAMGHTNFQHLLAPEDFHRMNDYVDLAESNEIDEEDLSDVERATAVAARDAVLPPKRLILERQLHKSILIGWLHPDCPKGMVETYQIYVDGVLKSTVPAGERTKALVEGVDSSMPHRISVRAVTPQGRMSKDAACTVVIGKNVPFAPCCVRATNITSESALISWLPCNSNFYHVVAVNSVEVRTVGPAVYKHLITGLAANTLYRVSVRAKPGKLLCSDEKNPKKLEMLTTFVDFRTLPKSLPEPPVDIQVEAGPQDGTLLVTWLPVTLDQFGTSNGCPVTGYAVFAAHKKLAEIDRDHALLDVSQVESFHKKSVTVRTKSGENLSADSMPCQIPDDLLKFTTQRKFQQTNIRTARQQQMTRQAMQQQKMNTMNRNIQNRQQQSMYQVHHDENVVDTTSRMTIPAIEITKETPSESINPLESYSEEEYETMIKSRGGRYGPSPVPPHRNRQLTDYERSSMGHTDPHRTRAGVQKGIRWFVALYDYDPLTMSPNPDAADEELPFREGDMIKIHGDKDPDGFYRGELNGRFGFVPCNMVSEMQYDSEMGPMKQGQDPWSHLPVKKMVALYDYDPQELSPNPDAEMELAFNTGDIIYIYGEMDEDGFYMGEINGVRGLVPSNFLTEVASNETSARHVSRSKGGGAEH
ncbi:RIMS-binding protein 2-like protein [Leptotrombidium deliense]|uniref:RIMS-binding protein 2-like protein n=1 Tax=Leptotrombidium deliense TaxID=299467 RepID=A0A443SEZ4_9ACAR|nr:RIMS-binding protein 2-like protein [Leptotrombidium deliense]